MIRAALTLAFGVGCSSSAVTPTTLADVGPETSLDASSDDTKSLEPDANIEADAGVDSSSPWKECFGAAPTCRKGTIGKTCGNETWKGGCFEGAYWTCTNMPGGIPAAECGCIAASSGTAVGDPCPSDGGLDVGPDADDVADGMDG